MLVVVLYLTGGVLSGVRTAANVVVSPFSWSVNEVARPIGHFLAGAIDYSDVVAQNQRLRYELGRAQQQANEQWSFERQLEQISTQLHVPFIGSLPTVAAQVTALSPTRRRVPVAAWSSVTIGSVAPVISFTCVCNSSAARAAAFVGVLATTMVLAG